MLRNSSSHISIGTGQNHIPTRIPVIAVIADYARTDIYSILLNEHVQIVDPGSDLSAKVLD
jgi:hypothetical protein